MCELELEYVEVSMRDNFKFILYLKIEIRK